MEKFIKKQQFNYIRRELKHLDRTNRTCMDKKVIEATNLLVNEKINNIINELNEEQKELLDLSQVKNSYQIEKYIEKISDYVYGMTDITEAEIKKAFKGKKEVKTQEVKKVQNKPLVYIGWKNTATNKLYIIYHLDGKFEGIECSIVPNDGNNKCMCALCHSVGDPDKVAFVSVICKNKKGGGINNYKSIGFSVCLDNESCNERIMDVSKLEELIKIAKGIA